MDLFSYLLGKKSAGGSTSNLQAKETTITTNETTNITPDEGYDGLSSVSVTTNVPNDITVDTSVTYSQTYGIKGLIKSVGSIDTSNMTNMAGMFADCPYLESVSLINAARVTNMMNMFNNCPRLTTIPELNTSSVRLIGNMFASCPLLSDTSLDNILKMCVNAVNVTNVNNKKLSYLGFNSTNYAASRIESLPHYQDFIDAGWVIGY